MLGADVLAWLIKLLAGETLKSRLNRGGLKTEVRVLRKALQERRDELDEIERTAATMAGRRDAYFAEIVRLRADNVALRAEVERLRAAAGGR